MGRLGRATRGATGSASWGATGGGVAEARLGTVSLRGAPRPVSAGARPPGEETHYRFEITNKKKKFVSTKWEIITIIKKKYTGRCHILPLLHPNFHNFFKYIDLK